MEFHRGSVVWARSGSTFPFYPACIVPQDLLPADIRQPLFSSPFDDAAEGFTSEALKRKLPVYYYGRNDFDLVRPAEIRDYLTHASELSKQYVREELQVTFKLAMDKAERALSMSADERLQWLSRPDLNTILLLEETGSEVTATDMEVSPTPLSPPPTIISSGSPVPVSEGNALGFFEGAASSPFDNFPPAPTVENITQFPPAGSSNVASPDKSPVEATGFFGLPQSASFLPPPPSQLQPPPFPVSTTASTLSPPRVTSTVEAHSPVTVTRTVVADTSSFFGGASTSVDPFASQPDTFSNDSPFDTHPPATIFESPPAPAPAPDLFPVSSDAQSSSPFDSVPSSAAAFDAPAPAPDLFLVGSNAQLSSPFDSVPSSAATFDAPAPVADVPSSVPEAPTEFVANSSIDQFPTRSDIPESTPFDAPVLAAPIANAPFSNISAAASPFRAESSIFDTAPVDTSMPSSASPVVSTEPSMTSEPTSITASSSFFDSPPTDRQHLHTATTAEDVFGVQGGENNVESSSSVVTGSTSTVVKKVVTVTKSEPLDLFAAPAPAAASSSASVTTVSAGVSFAAPSTSTTAVPSSVAAPSVSVGTKAVKVKAVRVSDGALFGSPGGDLFSPSSSSSAPFSASSDLFGSMKTSNTAASSSTHMTFSNVASNPFDSLPAPPLPTAASNAQKKSVSAVDVFSSEPPQIVKPAQQGAKKVTAADVFSSAPPPSAQVFSPGGSAAGGGLFPPAAPGVKIPLPSNVNSGGSNSVSQQNTAPGTPTAPAFPSSATKKIIAPSKPLPANAIPTPHGFVVAPKAPGTTVPTPTASAGLPRSSTLEAVAPAVITDPFSVPATPAANSGPPLLSTTGPPSAPGVFTRSGAATLPSNTPAAATLPSYNSTAAVAPQGSSRKIHKPVGVVFAFGFGGRMAVSFPPANAVPPVYQSMNNRFDTPLHRLPLIGAHPCPIAIHRMQQLPTRQASHSAEESALLEQKLFKDLLVCWQGGELLEGRKEDFQKKANAFVQQMLTQPTSRLESVKRVLDKAAVGSNDLPVDVRHHAAVESEVLLWRTLDVFLNAQQHNQSSDKDGLLNEKEEKLVGLLLEGVAAASNTTTAVAPMLNASIVEPACTATEVEALLLRGRRDQALDLALEREDFALALVIASVCPVERYQETVKRLALKRFSAQSPLHTFSLAVSNQASNASIFVKPAVKPAAFQHSDSHNQKTSALVELLSHWRQNLAMVLANKPANWTNLVLTLSKRLAEELGDSPAAQVALLCGNALVSANSDRDLLLLGALSSRREQLLVMGDALSLRALRASELYEAMLFHACQQGRQKPQSASNAGGATNKSTTGIFGWVTGGSSNAAGASAPPTATAVSTSAAAAVDETVEQFASYRAFLLPLKLRTAIVLADWGYVVEARRLVQHVQQSVQQHSALSGVTKLSKKFLRALEEFEERLLGHSSSGTRESDGSGKKEAGAVGTDSQSKAPSSWGTFSLGINLKDFVDGPSSVSSKSVSAPPTASGASVSTAPFSHAVPNENPFSAPPTAAATPRAPSSAFFPDQPPTNNTSNAFSHPPPTSVTQSQKSSNHGGFEEIDLHSTSGPPPTMQAYQHAVTPSNGPPRPPGQSSGGLYRSASASSSASNLQSTPPQQGFYPSVQGNNGPNTSGISTFNPYNNNINSNSNNNGANTNNYDHNTGNSFANSNNCIAPNPSHAASQSQPPLQTSQTQDANKKATAAPAASKPAPAPAPAAPAEDLTQAATTGIIGTLRKGIIKWMLPNAVDATENTGSKLEAYFDKNLNRWVFPGEEAQAAAALAPPPTGPLGGAAAPSNNSNSSGGTTIVTSFSNAPAAPQSSSSSNDMDPLAALMAPPPRSMPSSQNLAADNDPLALMMRPPPVRSLPGSSANSSSGNLASQNTSSSSAPPPKYNVWKPAAVPSPTAQSAAISPVQDATAPNAAAASLLSSESVPASSNAFHQMPPVQQYQVPYTAPVYDVASTPAQQEQSQEGSHYSGPPPPLHSSAPPAEWDAQQYGASIATGAPPSADVPGGAPPIYAQFSAPPTNSNYGYDANDAFL